MKRLYYIFSATILALVSCNKQLDELPDNQVRIDSPEKVKKLLVNAYPQVSASILNEFSSDNIDDILGYAFTKSFCTFSALSSSTRLSGFSSKNLLQATKLSKKGAIRNVMIFFIFKQIKNYNPTRRLKVICLGLGIKELFPTTSGSAPLSFLSAYNRKRLVACSFTPKRLTFIARTVSLSKS